MHKSEIIPLFNTLNTIFCKLSMRRLFLDIKQNIIDVSLFEKQ